MWVEVIVSHSSVVFEIQCSFTFIGRFVDWFVELNEREQVVVAYADDTVTTETVRCDVTRFRGDGELSMRHRTRN